MTGRIFDRLASHYGREAVFRDIDSIRTGLDFREEIAEALRQSDVLLVVIGPKWLGRTGWRARINNESDPVRVEVETALDQHIPVIPVLVGGTKMPDADRLPASMQRFAFRHGVSIDGGVDFETHMDRLRREIDRMILASPKASPPAVGQLGSHSINTLATGSSVRAQSRTATKARENTPEKARPNRRAFLMGGAVAACGLGTGLVLIFSNREAARVLSTSESKPLAAGPDVKDASAEHPAMPGPSARMRRIGVVFPNNEDDPMAQPRVVGLQQGLAELGWTVGGNIRIDYRWGAADAQQVRAIAEELVALPTDVILANTSRAVAALEQATRTVPIVFLGVVEPVDQGFVQSLAHPGGNITGFSNAETTLGAKWLELLKEVAPSITRVAFVFNPDNGGGAQFADSAAVAAGRLAVELVTALVHGPAEIEAAITRLGREPGAGLIFPPDGFTLVHRKLIVELAARYRLPAIYGVQNFAFDGGLAYYGVNIDDQYRQAAAYVDRILRGEKPGDLPVQQPSKYDLIINLKTAKALGLTVPLELLNRADMVIE
jgi:putative ABC transport system substrate-binding protein